MGLVRSLQPISVPAWRESAESRASSREASQVSLLRSTLILMLTDTARGWMDVKASSHAKTESI